MVEKDLQIRRKNMKLMKMSIAALLAITATNAQAAYKDYQVKTRMTIVEDDQVIHPVRRQSFGFRVEILNDTEGIKAETVKNGYPFVTATKGERYSVRLYNPQPVRVAVNLTVDGLNSITGKPSGISDGEKWMIEPYSSITIPGWQVSGGDARRFFFTGKYKSYAQWRGDELGEDLAANCGVIGAAYFWNQKELDQYYEEHPVYRMTYHAWPNCTSRAKKSCESMAAGAPCADGSVNMDMRKAEAAAPEAEAKEQAGTGMGERESHPTIQVAFNYDSGMYTLPQAVVIYYGFEDHPSPNPFPAKDYAPEMP